MLSYTLPVLICVDITWRTEPDIILHCHLVTCQARSYDITFTNWGLGNAYQDENVSMLFQKPVRLSAFAAEAIQKSELIKIPESSVLEAWLSTALFSSKHVRTQNIRTCCSHRSRLSDWVSLFKAGWIATHSGTNIMSRATKNHNFLPTTSFAAVISPVCLTPICIVWFKIFPHTIINQLYSSLRQIERCSLPFLKAQQSI